MLASTPSWRRIATAVFATLAAAAACVPAQAQVSFAASATNLRYTLVDLDLNDGIAPSVDFTGATGGYSLANQLTVDRPGQPRAEWSDSLDVTAPGSLDHAVGAAAHSTAAWDGRSLRVEAFVSPDGVSSARFYQYAGPQGVDTFTLSPKTGITFLVDVAVDFTTSGFDNDTSGWGAAGMVLSGKSGGAFTWDDFGDRVSGIIDNHPGGDYPADLHLSKTATITWNNVGTSAGTGLLETYAKIDGAVAPVPEPGEWAMLGVGCALLGWRARQKRRS